MLCVKAKVQIENTRRESCCDTERVHGLWAARVPNAKYLTNGKNVSSDVEMVG